MAQASQTSEAARRYASALFDLAQEKGLLADVQSAFARFTETISGSKDLSRLIVSPLFSREDKSAVLTQIAKTAGMPELFEHFLGAVSMNGRAGDLPGTYEAFETLYAKQRGVQRAVARTAESMTSDQLVRLETIIAKAVGGDVELTTEVEPDLVGGIQLRIGSTLIDASLKAKLERLNTAMKGA